MDREFGSNMSYSALENTIIDVRTNYENNKEVNDALDMVINHIKLNYTYKGE